MRKSTLKIGQGIVCLVMQGFSNYLGLFQVMKWQITDLTLQVVKRSTPTICIHIYIYTPWKFNIAPENIPSQRRVVFQPSFFTGYVKLREGIYIYTLYTIYYQYLNTKSKAHLQSFFSLQSPGIHPKSHSYWMAGYVSKIAKTPLQ